MQMQIDFNCTDAFCQSSTNYDDNFTYNIVSSTTWSVQQSRALQVQVQTSSSKVAFMSPGCRLYDFIIETVLMGSLCLFGFAGNSLSMVCLRRDKSRSATPLLLISLELTDTLFLSAVFVVRVVRSFQVCALFTIENARSARCINGAIICLTASCAVHNQLVLRFLLQTAAD